MRKLPLELVAEICRFLRPEHNFCDEGPFRNTRLSESKAALHACSLVCWSWHAVAQEHLFHDVVYSYKEKQDDNDTALVRKPEYGRWGMVRQPRRKPTPTPLKSLAMLIGFLDDNPRFRRHIRCLKLKCYYNLWDADGWFDRAPEDAVDLADLRKLLTLLPRLAVLHLQNLTLKWENLGSLPGARIPLQELRLSWCEGSTIYPELAAVLGCFSVIDELNFENLELDPSPEDIANSISELYLPVHVRSLYVDDVGSDEDQLVRLVKLCKSLRRVVLAPDISVDPLKVRPLLATVSDTLQDVHALFFPYHSWTADDDRIIDFSHCTRLRNVTLSIPILNYRGLENVSVEDQAFTFTIEEARKTLQTISSPLRSLTLNIGAYIEPREDKLAKDKLHNFLTGSAPLDSVLCDLAHRHGLTEICVEYFDEIPELDHIVALALPSLAEQGLLKVRWRPMDPIPEPYKYLEDSSDSDDSDYESVTDVVSVTSSESDSDVVNKWDRHPEEWDEEYDTADDSDCLSDIVDGWADFEKD